MNDEQLKLLKDAIEKGITKGIQKVGIENVDWFSIKSQNKT